MKYKRISLEDLEISPEVNDSQQITITDIQNKEIQTEMSVSDKTRLDSLISITNKQDAIVSLEAITHHLKRNGASAVGKSGVMFANVAIEQFCNIANVSLEEMPLDTNSLENPNQMVTDGISNISNIKDDINNGIKDNVVEMIYQLSVKRESYNKALKILEHRVDEVYEQLDRFKQLEVEPKLKVTQFDFNNNYANISYGDKGVVSKASTVIEDITKVMCDHSSLFESLTTKQLVWMNEHKENILTTIDGFSEYRFYPFSYLPNGWNKIVIESEKEKVFTSKTLPGNVNVYIQTTSKTLTGYAAAQSLKDTKVFLKTARGITEEMLKQQITVLTLVEIEARIAEIKTGICKFKEWSDFTYKDLWKDVFFDKTILTFLLKKDANNINERGLSMLSLAVISLLNNATVGLDQYLITTFSSLLNYVEDSLKAYSNEDL